jgi:drug/metabolite transporter (DMT)-like permease
VNRSAALSSALPGAAFVLVWSSGYIAGPYGVTTMAPLTLVGARFALATVLAVLVARMLRGPLRIERRIALRIAVVGFVMNGLQFCAMYLAFAAGLGATLGALLHSLSPVLTVLLAGVILNERLAPIQVGGFVVGIAGVLLVLGPDVDSAGGAAGLGWALLGMSSLSLGTLGQRWIGLPSVVGTRPDVDPFWSAAIQFGASAPPVIAVAYFVEGTNTVYDARGAVIALLYLAVVNSIVGLALLGVLVRARGAGVASSVFFLMPPVTAVLAWFVLGDTLSTRELAGLLVAVTGVALATRFARTPATEPVA